MSERTYKSYTIQELINDIYNDNLVHFDDRDTSDDCDCNVHSTIKMIVSYLGE
jgi:redox-regulated HSP33 family molecular chaperone